MTDELKALIESVRGYKMTPAERFEQRVSFVWGGLAGHSTLTKDDVRAIMRDGWDVAMGRQGTAN